MQKGASLTVTTSLGTCGRRQENRSSGRCPPSTSHGSSRAATGPRFCPGFFLPPSARGRLLFGRGWPWRWGRGERLLCGQQKVSGAVIAHRDVVVPQQGGVRARRDFHLATVADAVADEGHALFPTVHEPVVMLKDGFRNLLADDLDGPPGFRCSGSRSEFQVLQFVQPLKDFHFRHRRFIRSSGNLAFHVPRCQRNRGWPNDRD